MSVGYVVLGLGAYQAAAEGLLDVCQSLLEDYIAAREIAGDSTNTLDIQAARNAIAAAERAGIRGAPAPAQRGLFE